MSKELNEAAEARYPLTGGIFDDAISRAERDAYIKGAIEWQAQQDRWIPCSERLPDDDKWVIRKGSTMSIRYDGENWVNNSGNVIYGVKEWKYYPAECYPQPPTV